MKNKFVDTLLFLEEFQLKEASEKQSFFMSLKDNLDMFPDDISKYKILPKLIHVSFLCEFLYNCMNSRPMNSETQVLIFFFRCSS